MMSFSNKKMESSAHGRLSPGEGCDSGRRTALVVLGMHRSGTSALTRVISLFGAHLPANVIGKSRSNQGGHWESRRLTDLHEQLLADCNSAWHDWRPLELTLLPHEKRAAYKADIADELGREFGNAETVVIKDPRACRFASFFFDAASQAGFSIMPVMVFRNPIEVINSIMARAQDWNETTRKRLWRADYSRADAALLWLDHNLRAEEAIRNYGGVVLAYEKLVSDWRSAFAPVLEVAGKALDYRLEDNASQIDSFLSSDLRHEKSAMSDVALDPVLHGWVKTTYEALLALSANPDSQSARDRLDRVRTEFGNALPIMDSLVSSVQSENAALQAKLGGELDALHEASIARDAELDSLKKQNDALTTEKHAVKKRIAGLERKVGDLQGMIENVRNAEQVRGSEHIAALSKAIIELRHSAKLERQAIEEGRDKARQDVASAELRLAQVQAELEDLHNQLADSRKQAEALESLSEKHEKLSEERKELLLRSSDLKQQRDERDDRIRALTSQIKSYESEIRSLQRGHEKSQARLSEIDASFRSSTSWKVTVPLRAVAHLHKSLWKAPAIVRASVSRGGGVLPTAEMAFRILRAEGLSGVRKRIDHIRAGTAWAEKKRHESVPASVAPLVRVAPTDMSDIALVESSGLFDRGHYNFEAGTNFVNDGEALRHYLDNPISPTINPGPLFNVWAYRAANAGLLAEDDHPLLHYLRNHKLPEMTAAPAFKPGRIAVFTANISEYDTLSEPANPSPDADYFVFTDGEVPSDSLWRKLELDYIHVDPTRTARFYKVHPHLYFREYDYSVWIDSNLGLQATPEAIIETVGADKQFGTWMHPLRDCVYDEAEECAKRRKEEKDLLSQQMEQFRTTGFPEHGGLFETSVVVRRHNDPDVVAAMSAWWREIDSGTKRDQIALMKALDERPLEIGYIAEKGICMRTDPRFLYKKHIG